MSSALETNPSAAAALPSTLRSAVAQNIGKGAMLTTDINTTHVSITFHKEDDLWVATGSPANIPVPFDQLRQIMWTLFRPEGLASDAPLQFDESPISFPPEQPEAPMVVINGAAGTTELVALWANVDPTKTRSYNYTVNMWIADQRVAHDPTVENIPPTQ